MNPLTPGPRTTEFLAVAVGVLIVVGAVLSGLAGVFTGHDQLDLVGKGLMAAAVMVSAYVWKRTGLKTTALETAGRVATSPPAGSIVAQLLETLGYKVVPTDPGPRDIPPTDETQK